MARFLLVAGLLTAVTAVAYAQPPVDSSAPQLAAAPANLASLVGRDVRDLNGQTIGEIRSVSMTDDGTVQGVTVSLENIAGLGGRVAHVWWRSLHVSDGGQKVALDIEVADLRDMVQLTSPHTPK